MCMCLGGGYERDVFVWLDADGNGRSLIENYASENVLDMAQKIKCWQRGWIWMGTAVFLFATVFPLGWLAEQWPLFERITNFLFGTEAAHVIGHFMLFSGLGAVLLMLFPRLQTDWRLYFVIMYSFGFIQETLQIVSFKERPFGSNELFDIVIDLLAAGFVFAVFRWRFNKDWRLENRD